MKKTIQYLKEFDDKKYREYESDWGTGASVDVVFTDGDEGQCNTKPDYAEKHVDALSKLVGVESEFELESRGQYKEIPQWKIKQYPGKPTGQGQQGGGGGRTGDWETSIERRQRQASIMAQSAFGRALDATVGRIEDAAEALSFAMREAPNVFAAFLDLSEMYEERLIKTSAVEPVQPKPPAVIPKHDTGGSESPERQGGPENAQDWQLAFDEAVKKFGSPVRLQIAMKKNPEEMSLDELLAAIQD